VFPARRRISFVGKRGNGLLVSGALGIGIRILAAPAAARGKLAVPARLSPATVITALLVAAGVLVASPVPPAVSEGAVSLVLIGRGGVTVRAVGLTRTLAGIVLPGVSVPVGVSLIRIGLTSVFLVAGLLVALVTVLRPRITGRALRTREDLVLLEILDDRRRAAFISLDALATLLGVSVTAVSLLWPGCLSLILLALLPLILLALALVILTLITLLGLSPVVVPATGISPAVLALTGVHAIAVALTGIRPVVLLARG
jgi:hypothetical protein